MLQKLLQMTQLVLIAFLLVVLSMSTFSFATQLSKLEILEDAKQLEKRLNAFHPNKHAHRTRKQIQFLWSTYKDDIPDNPNYLDAAIFFQKVLAALCDEHTGIQLNHSLVSASLIDNMAFPVGLAVLGDKLYLDNGTFASKTHEITQINEKSSVEIISFLRSLSSNDGCQKSELLFSYNIMTPFFSSVLLTNFLGQGEEFGVEFKNTRTGKSFKRKIEAISMFKTKNWEHTAVRGRSSFLKLLDIKFNDHALKALDQSPELSISI